MWGIISSVSMEAQLSTRRWSQSGIPWEYWNCNGSDYVPVDYWREDIVSYDMEASDSDWELMFYTFDNDWSTWLYGEVEWVIAEAECVPSAWDRMLNLFSQLWCC
jgi:hypothetical protein